jgi:tetratricopeptide (TPR) repeat protein
MSTLAHEALAIDRHLSEAHAVLAAAAMIDFQWDTAAHHFRQALITEAFHSMVSFLYAGFFLPALGRYSEAMAHLDEVLRQDPLNIQLRNSAGSVKMAINDPGGIALLERILDAEPKNWIAAGRLSGWHWRHHEVRKARVYAEQAHALVPRHHPSAGVLAAIVSLEGDERRAASLLEILGDGKAGGAPAGWFHYHMARGETGLAAHWLERAIEQRDTRTPYILTRFWGGDFTSTPHWPPLERTMNLPAGDGRL